MSLGVNELRHKNCKNRVCCLNSITPKLLKKNYLIYHRPSRSTIGTTTFSRVLSA